jgi:uncharacterized protein YbjT (DUF2867 family)
MILVLAGATGLVGHRVLEIALGSTSHFTEVRVLVRRSTGLQSPKLKEIIVQDFTKLEPSQIQELQGDVYVCALGTTIKTAGSKSAFREVDFDRILQFAAIAKQHQAQQFLVVSATGANPKSLVFYNQVKGEVELALQKLNFKRLVIFRPGLLLGRRDARQSPRPAEALAIHFFQGIRNRLGSIGHRLTAPVATSVEVLSHAILAEAARATAHQPIQIIEAPKITANINASFKC